SVEASSTDRYPETYPFASIVRYDFAARGDMPAVKFSWYDGGVKPARPDEFDKNLPLRGEGEEGDEGLLFIGDSGKIFCSFNGAHPKLIPEEKMKSYKQPSRLCRDLPATSGSGSTPARAAKSSPAEIS